MRPQAVLLEGHCQTRILENLGCGSMCACPLVQHCGMGIANQSANKNRKELDHDQSTTLSADRRHGGSISGCKAKCLCLLSKLRPWSDDVQPASARQQC